MPQSQSTTKQMRDLPDGRTVVCPSCFGNGAARRHDNVEGLIADLHSPKDTQGEIIPCPDCQGTGHMEGS